MGPLSNKNENEEEWSRVEQALREVRPEPLPLSNERAHAIMQNALAETSRRRTKRPLPFFTSLFPVSRVGYGLVGSVTAVAIVSFLFVGRAENTRLHLSEQKGVAVSGRNHPIEDKIEKTPQDAPPMRIRSPKPGAASSAPVSYPKPKIVRRKKVQQSLPVVRLQYWDTALPVVEESRVTDAPVTFGAIRAYQEATLAYMPAPDRHPAPPEETPRLLVVVSHQEENEEPELSLAVHDAPTTEVGYAEASAVHQKSDGSLVWERCALQSGRSQPFFFQIQELGPSAKDGVKIPSPSIENRHPLDEGAKSERRLKIPEIEEIEYETKYRDTVLYWAGRTPKDMDGNSSAFRSGCAYLCSGSSSDIGAQDR